MGALVGLEKELENYPYTIVERKISDTDITIVGVHHTNPFFEMHKNLIENLIFQNDSVFLEKPIHSEFWEYEFYTQLGNISNNLKKKVFQSDPRTPITDLVDEYIQPIIAALFLLSMAKEGKKTDYNRREFLNSAGKLGLGLGLAWGTCGASVFRELITDNSGYGLADLVSYGEFDYSNVLIADGLANLSKKGRTNSIVAFHGASHTLKIVEYLDKPALRKIKKLYYAPYLALGSPFIKEYTPLQDGTWALTGAF
ncbi:hypothetical protein GOV05_04670 [Candidatus Woesearchaeota archaeon]|nr:hypothetical protein [Candidatus Woesearchaeota archaeon]